MYFAAIYSHSTCSVRLPFIFLRFTYSDLKKNPAEHDAFCTRLHVLRWDIRSCWLDVNSYGLHHDEMLFSSTLIAFCSFREVN